MINYLQWRTHRLIEQKKEQGEKIEERRKIRSRSKGWMEGKDGEFRNF